MLKEKPISIRYLQKMKQNKQKITALTAYDATYGRLLDQAGLDVILVGDSLGMVVQGSPDTLSVTVDEMVYHTRIVSKSVQHALLVADMPFLSYQTSISEAIQNAGRLLKEGRASAVKLEGGLEMIETIRRLTEIGIPVMGHIGMQPQRVRQYGGYRLQGSKEDQADRILKDAIAIENAGVFAVVLEKIPMTLAQEITNRLRIPTIGIASGPHCDGQILVSYDMLGLEDQFNFKFVRKYLNLAEDVKKAVSKYCDDIRKGDFPNETEGF